MQLAQRVLGIAILGLLAVAIAGAAFSGHVWCALGIVCLTLLVSSVVRWTAKLSGRAETNIAFGESSLRAHAAVLKILRESDASLSRIEARIAALEAPTVPVQRRVVN